MSVCTNPKSGAVKEQNLQTRVSAVDEDKERSRTRVFIQAFSDPRMETVETFSQVTRFDRQEHLETPGKTQHGASGSCRAFTNAATRGA